ncbi:MAG: methylmalonyl Co-A mutase-associated GTPase MeaB [Bacteroidales bacterium]|nr:methylmalonyl Co-A mutase-associated GTPase MeaB [Bacteroidales bacterium]
MPKKNESYKSALSIQKGVNQPEQINKDAITRFRKSKIELLTADAYYDGILQGNRAIFSKAITLVESRLPQHYELAQNVIDKCLPHAGDAIRIGITGVPGVGKSTFIDAFGTYLTRAGKRVAVLAVDPSSKRSGGSILGDKTRMEALSNDPNAFIRPSPSAGSLGGVARKTREIITLCEAAGYDVIIVETVGVGQSETAVYNMVDFFLLLMLAGAGDELQGIKRGIMEMCDALYINKADDNNINKAKIAAAQYRSALHLLPEPPSGWTPVTGICSAISGKGIDEVWNTIREFCVFTKNNGYFEENRKKQNIQIITESIKEQLENDFFSNEAVKSLLPKLEKMTAENKISGYIAAKKLLDAFERSGK